MDYNTIVITTGMIVISFMLGALVGKTIAVLKWKNNAKTFRDIEGFKVIPIEFYYLSGVVDEHMKYLNEANNETTL